MPAKIKKASGCWIDYRHTFGDGSQLVRITYTDGVKRDAYTVTRQRDSLEVEWSHCWDGSRSYRVTCTVAGVPIACECKGSEYKGTCRHRKGTAALLERGELACGPDYGEQPEGWGWSDERDEAEADFRRLCGTYPKVAECRAD